MGRETRTHIRRMSVDVGLFLGQKGLQVRSRRRGSSELSPTQGHAVTKETESYSSGGVGNVTAVGEREKGESRVVEEKAAVKHGGKRKGSKRLKRSFRLGSTEEEDTISEGSSHTEQQPSPQLSQIPPPKTRQGRFRSSLKKTSSDESSGLVDSGSMVSMVSMVSVVEKPGISEGGGKIEKKSKFGASFPRRRWSWKLRKTENETETIPRENDPHLQVSIKEEGGVSFENSVEDLFTASPTRWTQTGDSWTGHAPNRAFTPSPAPNKSFIGNCTDHLSFTKQTSL